MIFPTLRPFIAFELSVLTLLFVPGPSNTLMLVSGASMRLLKSFTLVPMELAGYVLSIAFWGNVVGSDTDSLNVLPTVIKALATAYILWLAIKLWGKESATSSQIHITPKQVFITALMNPKGIVFGIVIFPKSALHSLTLYGAMFCISVV